MDSKVIIDLEKKLEGSIDLLNHVADENDVEGVLLRKIQEFKRELRELRRDFQMEFVGDVAHRLINELPNPQNIKVNFRYKTKLSLKIYNDWSSLNSYSTKKILLTK